MIRVVVADAQPLVRASLRAQINSTADIRVVAEAADGVAALEAVERLQPDVLLIELRAHGLDAVDAARLVEGTRIVALTPRDQDDYLLDALRAGASAFVVKGAEAADVVEALRVVTRGDAVFAPSRMRGLLGRALRVPSRRPLEPPWFRALSEQDRALLIRVAWGRSNREIARELGMPEALVCERLMNLLRRLGLRERVQAAVRAYESGVLTPGREVGERGWSTRRG